MKTDFCKILLVVGGLISTYFVYGQNVDSNSDVLLQDCLESYLSSESKKLTNEPNFKKAYQFLLKNESDSVLLYTEKYRLSKDRSANLIDYNRFFRARSLQRKKLFDESLSELRKINTTFPLYASAMSLKAGILTSKGMHQEAIAIYFEILNLPESDRCGVFRSSLIHNVGVCYLYEGNYEKSEEYLIEALGMQLDEKDTHLIVSSYGDIANLYYTQYRDEEAIPYFIKAYDLSILTSDFELKRNTAHNMAVVEENRGDFEKSIAYRKEYDQWKDSTNNEEKVWSIAQMEKKHIAETKQREIGLLQRENQLKAKQRNWILIGAGALLFVLVLIIYFYWQKIRTSAIIADQRESLDKLNSFKNRLFSIVSHDLRSSVHGLRRSTEQLRNEIPENDSKIKSLVNQQGAIANSTYGMLDNLLNWALLQSDEIYFQPEKVSLKRLMPQVILNYQPLLDQKNISVHLNIPSDAKVHADVDSTKIVLRNVLDNAIKFSPEGGELHIDASVDEDTCQLSIKDNGPGMTPEQIALVVEQSSQVSKESGEERSGTGLGVRLCASFMLKNNGSFQMESEIGIGTTVILTFQKV